MSGSGWVITLSWLCRSLKSVLHSSSVHSCHLFLISYSMSILFLAFIACNVLLLSPVSWRHLYSFPLYCFPIFLCIGKLGRPYSLSSLFSGTLHSVGYIFPFLLCLLSLFFSQLFVKPPQTITLPSCIAFSLGRLWSLPTVQCFLWDDFSHCLLYNVTNLCSYFFRHSVYQF